MIAEGRWINASKACENPTCVEIGDCCSYLKLPFAIEGRRINASKACVNPTTCVEIGDCCSYLKLPFAIEIDKAYPRDFMQRGRVRVLLKKEDGTLCNPIDKAYPRDFMQRGRVRVLLKKEDGTLCNPVISSRKQLILHVAELVPRHLGRTKKQEPTSTSTAAPSKSGKGGKKKR
ncbi:unnamed protein product [Ilex paraguariensis]|uniref:Signal recognition particle 19 kDa protein n=1 Tax=Ilex paraguariensis TaxID=185542 RepID=A0ABC8UTV5_9AQUA